MLGIAATMGEVMFTGVDAVRSVLSLLSESGQEVQGGDVVGPHDCEVASIEGSHVTDRQPFRGGDDGAIDGSQWQIAIGLDQFSDPKPVFGRDVLGDQISRGDVSQEPDLSVVTEPGPEQVDHLGNHQDGYQQWARMGLEQFEALGVVVVVCVNVGVERACVDEERYRETSLRRIPSMRTETSFEPLRPAAEAINFRRPSPAPRWASMASRVSSDTVEPRRSAS